MNVLVTGATGFIGRYLVERLTAVHHFDLWRFLRQSEVEEVFATSHSGEWGDEAAPGRIASMASRLGVRNGAAESAASFRRGN